MIAIPLIPLGLVLALMLVGSQFGGRAQTVAASACGDHAMQERIRAMMLEGVETAFTEHVASLHTVWMRDAHEQPQRASVGLTRGIDAYVHARGVIAAWSLKPC